MEIKKAIEELKSLYNLNIVRQSINLSFFNNIEEAKKVINEIALNVDNSIKNFYFTEYVKKFAEWLLNNDFKGLGLIGDYGTGKTLLACNILPVLFYLKYNLIIKPIKAYEINDEIYKDLIKKRIIIIDELGSESERVEFGNRVLYIPLIIDKCESDSKLLIFTTNRTPEDIIELYGKAIYDRICKLCKIIIFKGKSFRRI